jgi:hypothetical protein
MVRFCCVSEVPDAIVVFDDDGDDESGGRPRRQCYQNDRICHIHVCYAFVNGMERARPAENFVVFV